jgi:PIN domain nuclease of toxin-antitoxin system
VALLLDTCTFIWLAGDPSQLGEGARRAMDASAAEIWLSDVTVWEVSLKWQAGKLSLPGPPRSWIEEQRATWDLTRAPLELEHLYRSTELPSHHRDPFDRLLVAQSIVEGLTLVTPDPAIRAYPVSVLW